MITNGADHEGTVWTVDGTRRVTMKQGGTDEPATNVGSKSGNESSETVSADGDTIPAGLTILRRFAKNGARMPLRRGSGQRRITKEWWICGTS